MARNMKVFVYCTLSFILGCTFTVSVIKIDNSSVRNTDEAFASKIHRGDEDNFISKDTSTPHVKSTRKRMSAFLFILIMSSPDNTEQRNAIRETWATYTVQEDVQYFFVVGTKSLNNKQSIGLVKEYEKHQDLVLLAEVKDNYESLTTKLLRTLTWLNNAADFSFILKCDDDTFVRVSLLVKTLKDINQIRNSDSPLRLYWGFFDGRAHVRRVGKWAERNWVICDHYLPYALGGGYVLSKDLVVLIANRASDLELYRSEDVSVGAWLSAVKGLERKHDPRFDTEYLSRGCNEKYIVTHKKSPAFMRSAFNSLSVSGRLCPSGEFRVRNSYSYDWNAPPSRCCIRNDTTVP